MATKVPPWLQKNWPFVSAGVLIVFFVFQLSRAGGCMGSPPPPQDESKWPKQHMPEHMKIK